jgi:hypothetical protein
MQRPTSTSSKSKSVSSGKRVASRQTTESSQSFSSNPSLRKLHVRDKGLYDDDDDDEDNEDEDEDDVEVVVHQRKKVKPPRYSHHSNKDSMDEDEVTNNDSPLIPKHLTGSSISTYDAFENRFNKIEESVASLTEKVDRLLLLTSRRRSGSKESFQLSSFHLAEIGRLVRDDMFKAIKVLDADTIHEQGDLIFRQCLLKAKIQGQEDNLLLYDDVIKCVKRVLNVHKGHCKSKIRLASFSKYLFKINSSFSSHECI